MLTIAVCDDDRAELDGILGLLEGFRKDSPQYPFTVKAFPDPFTLLAHTEKNGGCDLYLLDIVMPGVTGIDCAKELRARGDAGEIVFLTTSKEYGVEAFGVKASDYIVKPVKREKLYGCLAEAWQRLSARRPPVAVRLVGGELRTVRTNEIAYIESFNHYREVRLVGGEALKTRTALREWKETLGEYPDFYMPNKSYIVNLEHIESITGSDVTVGGRVIALARDRRKTAADRYLEYLMRK